jgi:FtsH-binding integral membrane protein
VIFGYTFAEAKKTVIASAIFIATTLALFIAYDPGIKDAVVIVLGNGFAVAGVFLAPKFSVEDLSKTLAQLSGSVFTLLAFFFKVNPSLPVTIGSVIALIPIGYAIWKTKNLEPINMELPLPLAGPVPIAQSSTPPQPPVQRPIE